jgi:hypothetical protein
VNAALQHNLSPKTIRLMSQHLENFEQEGSHFSADFENTTLTEHLDAGATQLEIAAALPNRT